MRITHFSPSWAGVSAVALALAALPFAVGQSPQPAITLANTAPAALVAQPRPGVVPMPQNLRLFGGVHIGQSSERESFTLKFNQATTVTAISATADFHVNGGTCIENHAYSAGDVCSVDLVFTPQGPGRRTGKLSVAHTASAQPFVVPTGGIGYGPAVSFIPSLISTVPGTAPTGAGALLDPQALAIDGGDILYIADTYNHLIRYRDSSGVLSILAGGGSNASGTYSGAPNGVKLSFPYGITTDNSGGVYIADQGNNVVRYIRSDLTLYTAAGGGANAGPCTVAAPCVDNTVALPYPYSVAVDSSNNLFLNVNNGGSSVLPVEDTTSEFGPGSLAYLTLGHGSTWNYPIAVDASDNLYYTRGNSSVGGYSACTIVAQNQAFGTQSGGANFWRVAGTNVCGFSGDGGLATGAQISTLVEGFAWDAAGNFYFTDSGNNRVRRIDGVTGIIRTIAGNGSAGYSGDGGQATTALLKTPKGIAVDSFGNVYATSIVGQAGSTNMSVVREFGSVGLLTFATQAPTTSSPAQTIMVSNVGNQDLNFTHVAFTSGNPGDFAIDPNTTSCNFTVPLGSGHNCLVGIIFTPTATGTRSTVLTLLDDTVTGSNMIQLSGLSLPPATAIPSTTTLNFPTQAVGTTSAALQFTLSNTGGQTLNLSTYTFGGTNPTYFSQTHSCPGTLTINTGCTISVTFSPTLTGSMSATLLIGTSIGTVTINLSGKSATQATVTLSPTSLTFPSQTINTSSTAMQIVWNNTGAMPLTINSITFTGTNATYFTKDNGCVALSTVAGPWGCSIYVTFKPTAIGAASATLSINTSVGTKTVPLSGTGAAGGGGSAITRTTLASSASPAVAGRSIVFNSKVTSTSSSSPTGAVQLREGSIVLAQATLSAGSARLTLPRLSAGTHMLTAWYLGDKLHAASVSAALKQVVQ